MHDPGTKAILIPIKIHEAAQRGQGRDIKKTKWFQIVECGGG
jgi:hypothetical protein